MKEKQSSGNRNKLEVEHEAISVIREYGEAELVSFQKGGDIGSWDMSAVSREMSRDKEEKILTMDGVKMVGVDGILMEDKHCTESPEDLANIMEVSERELEISARKKLDGIKRNRKGYGIYCPLCLNTLGCNKCRGRGKRFIFIFRCKHCSGSGRCRSCKGDFVRPCPQCEKEISGYSLDCRFCGKRFRCPDCTAPVPLMATRCMSCKKEFICTGCGGRIPFNDDEKCPKCGGERKKW